MCNCGNGKFAELIAARNLGRKIKSTKFSNEDTDRDGGCYARFLMGEKGKIHNEGMMAGWTSVRNMMKSQKLLTVLHPHSE